MFNDIVESITAYERFDGQLHNFDILAQHVGAPYRVEVDDSFVATSDSLAEAREEVDDYIIRSGWLYADPCFA